MKVYVAGKMEWLDSEVSVWRESLQIFKGNLIVQGRQRVARLLPNLELIFPSEQWFDHGGDLVVGIVEADLKALEASDAVVAVFTDAVQVGTIVELMHALSLGKRCLAIFVPPTVDPDYPDWRGKDYVFLSGEVEMRYGSDHYWFLINYLLKFTNAAVAMARDNDSAIRAAGFWLLNL